MYYIKKIVLSTGDGTVSSVDLDSGLNIIYGESNTGKSLILDCIDYLFGAKRHRFDAKLDIKYVTLILDVDGKNLTMSRKLDSNDIEVSSLVENIESGTYKIGNTKKSINSVWLRLMGIDENVEILMTLGGRTQRLTLRTFSHTMLLDETRIQSQTSILSQGVGPNQKVATSVLTSFIYLATGNNYLPDEASKDPKIKKAKKDAVKTFVDRSMRVLETKKVSELENFSQESPWELQSKIDAAIDEIGAAEGAMKKAAEKMCELADQIYEIEGQMAESRMLANRNKALLTQYESDIKRLTFIVEGDLQHGKTPVLKVCPFCNGELEKKQSESCVDAAVAEVDKIEIQIRDLRSVQQSIEKELEELNEKKSAVIEERRQIDSVIRGELRPQITRLRSHLQDYTLALKQYKAKELIESFSDVLVKELEVSEIEAESGMDFKFDANRKFNEVFLEDLDEELKELLKASNYINFAGARFDDEEYDVVINGNLKKNQGQGYRALLNSILAMAFQNVLQKKNKYRPGLLVLDSPILSLKEKGDHDEENGISDTMKKALFKYFVNCQRAYQLIIIENDIPEIDYKKTNRIHFTKDENNGRYGLIENYRE